MKHKDTHLEQVNQNIEPKTPNGCEQCLQMGSDWVHLRFHASHHVTAITFLLIGLILQLAYCLFVH
jgi:hypothetical protein